MTAKPALLKISATEADTWLTCPRRYRHTYVDRPRPVQHGGPWAHFSLANSTHQALALLMDQPPGRRDPDRAERLLVRSWDGRGYRDDGHARSWLVRATEWVRRYAARPDVQAAHPVGNERTVSAVLEDWGLIITGRADRIDARGGVLAVVDYKTGRAAPTDDDAASNPALAVYSLAASRQFRTPCATAELHHLPTGTTATVTYDRESGWRHIERLRQIAADARDQLTLLADNVGPTVSYDYLADELYPATTGPLCASCPFRRICPEGRQAVPEAQPWAYLPD